MKIEWAVLFAAGIIALGIFEGLRILGSHDRYSIIHGHNKLYRIYKLDKKTGELWVTVRNEEWKITPGEYYLEDLYEVYKERSQAEAEIKAYEAEAKINAEPEGGATQPHKQPGRNWWNLTVLLSA